MQEELALALGGTHQAISKRLHAFGMIQKQGTWVPYDLKPRDVEPHLFACEQLLQRQKIMKNRFITATQRYKDYAMYLVGPGGIYVL